MSTEKIQVVVTAQDKASPTLKKFEGNMKSLGGKTGAVANLNSGLGALGIGALGVTTAIGGIMSISEGVGRALGGMVLKASDLNETVSKSTTVFGDSAEEMLKWSEDAAHAFGQSKKDALDTATTFGGLFKTVGQTVDVARQHAQEMTELGSDLASFFNTDVQTAVESLRSGLSGEAEPMRKFNVFLSEAAVNSQLLAAGQKKVDGAWTENQKIMARYQIILQQTADAQGDFARTQDGLANKTREGDAALEDMQANMGTKLLPLVKDLAGTMVDDVMPAMEDFVDLLSGKADMSNGFVQNFMGMMSMIPGQTGELAKQMLQQARVDELGAQMYEQIQSGMKAKAEADKAKMGQIGTFMASEVADRYADADPGQLMAMTTVNHFNDTITTIKFGSMLTDDLASELKAGARTDIKDAMDKVTWAIKHPLALAKQTAAIEGALTTLEFKRGLASNTPEVNAVIDQQIVALQQKWSSLTGIAYTKGVNASDALERGLRTFNIPREVEAVLGIRGHTTVLSPYGRDRRASGGPVSEGTYLVGERGPEILHMGRGARGNVTPNHQMGAGPIRVVSYQELRRLLDQDQGRQLALSPASAYTR